MGGDAGDVFQDIGNSIPVVSAFVPDPPPPPPPPDNRPTCDSYKKPKLSDSQLRGFNTDPNCKGTNTLSSWLEQARTEFCNDVNNFTLDPGGSAGTCIERNTGQALAREYCGEGDHIRTSAACTREYLGDNTYVELARAYCISENGKSDPWCSCYNVMNNVCDTDPNAAGCPEKAITYDVLVEKTPEAFRTAWSGREACYGLVCQESEDGPKYIPANANQNCAAPIQICGQSIQAEGITESTIDATCNIGGKEFDQDGNLVNPGNPAANLVANLPTDVQTYIPLSVSDITGDDPNKKIGLGASVSSSFMSCAFIVVILLLVTSGGGNSGPSRFRRR